MILFCIFGEKKLKKSKWEKAVEKESQDCAKPSHQGTLPDYSVFLTSCLRLVTPPIFIGSPHQLTIKTGKSLFYRVYASIFIQRWELHSWTQSRPGLSFHLFQNHRALFTTTKTHYSGFIIQPAAIWIG